VAMNMRYMAVLNDIACVPLSQNCIMGAFYQTFRGRSKYY
jgi:hypothetical protein